MEPLAECGTGARVPVERVMRASVTLGAPSFDRVVSAGRAVPLSGRHCAPHDESSSLGAAGGQVNHRLSRQQTPIDCDPMNSARLSC